MSGPSYEDIWFYGRHLDFICAYCRQRETGDDGRCLSCGADDRVERRMIPVRRK